LLSIAGLPKHELHQAEIDVAKARKLQAKVNLLWTWILIIAWAIFLLNLILLLRQVLK